MIGDHELKQLPELLRYARDRDPAKRCPSCEGAGYHGSRQQRAGISTDMRCGGCDGIGYHGIDPSVPSLCRPGSAGAVAVYAARYAAGRPLWRAEDSRYEAAHDSRQEVPDAGVLLDDSDDDDDLSDVP